MFLIIYSQYFINKTRLVFFSNRIPDNTFGDMVPSSICWEKVFSHDISPLEPPLFPLHVVTIPNLCRIRIHDICRKLSSYQLSVFIHAKTSHSAKLLTFCFWY